MVSAANSRVARVQATTTLTSSKPLSMSISSNCGLKIQMKGRITVRRA